MQTTTNLFRRHRKSFLLTGIFLLLVGWLQAFTYYSVPSATNFNLAASWNTGTDGISGTTPGSILSTDDYVIQNNSVLTLSGSFSVRSLRINATGILNVGANTLTIADGTNFNTSFIIAAGGRFNLTGGNILLNGSFAVQGTGRFDQSNGTFKVDGNNNGALATSVATGTPLVYFDSENLNLTGGNFIIVDPHAAAGTTDYALGYNGNGGAALISFGVNHTFQFGDGASSTDATANAAGFLFETCINTGRIVFGKLVINTTGTGSRLLVSNYWTGQQTSVLSDFTITSGDFRNISTALSVGGNILNNGTFTSSGTTSRVAFAIGAGVYPSFGYFPATGTQTIGGTGVFRNNTVNASSTANFANLTFYNTNAGTGVTFSNANSLRCITGGPSNASTVSSGVNFLSGNVSTGGLTFIQGTAATSATTAGALSWTAGGFTAGSIYRRWFAPATFTLTTAVAFPFVSGANSRRVTTLRSAAITTGGWIEATHTNTAALTASVFTDAGYNVQQRTNSNWTFTSNGTFNLGANTITVGLLGDGLLVLGSVGAAPRFIQSGAAAGTHVAGSGTVGAPFANRSFTNAQFASLAPNGSAATHYMGINSADVGFYSIQTGPWETGSTWSKGFAPGSADNPLVSTGHTVTVNSTAASALTVAVSGTLVVSGSTLNVGGGGATGVSVAGGGVLTVSGGTLNVGPTDNSFCNRALTLANGSTLNVSSGTLNLAGALSTSSGFTFNQSGGNINVDGNANGNGANSTGFNLFDLNVANATSINWTGGTLTFVDAPLGSLQYTINLNGAFNGPVTVSNGHTIRFGDGVSTTAGGTSGWYLNTWANVSGMHFGNVVINGPSGTNRFVTSVYNQPVRGNVTINTGGESRMGTLYIGGNLLNNGTLTSTTSLGFLDATFLDVSSVTFANATSSQSITGTGTFRNLTASPTANLTGLLFQNSSAGGITPAFPLTMNGNLSAINGKFNTTATNILTYIKTGSNLVYNGATTAGYITGPFQVTFPAVVGNTSNLFPVGKTSPDWFALFNVQNPGGPVTFQVEKNNTIGAPSTNDASLLALTPGSEWVTSIVSGASNLTLFNAQLYSSTIASGNVLAAIKSPATDFSVFGAGANFTAAGAPLFNFLAQTTPQSPGTDFPDRFAIGQTGPYNVNSVSMAQSVVAAVPAATTPGSTDNNLARVIVAVVGSTGAAALDAITFNYTGTALATDITSVSLWTGNFSGPTALITGATATINGLNQIVFTGLNTALASGANYYWVRFNVSGTAVIGNTVDIELASGSTSYILSGGATAALPLPATLQAPSGSVLIDYCSPTYSFGCGSGDEIARVLLAGSTITLNNGITSCSPGFYTFYSALNKPDLQQGSTYPISITVGSDGTQYTRAWVDFDQNGVFSAGESFSAGTSVGAGGTATFNIVVPGGATLGNTRLRVRGGDDSSIGAGQPCGASSSGFGETEDYIVTISAPTPKSLSSVSAVQQTGGMAASTTNNNLLRVDLAVAGSAGTLTLSQIRFTYTGTSVSDIAALGVSLWTGTSSAPSAQIGSNLSISGGFINFTGLSSVLNPGVNYLWLRVNTSAVAVIGNLVDAKIASGDITIAAILPAVAPGSQPGADVDPGGNRFIDYCTPTYSNGCSGYGDGIANVVLNGNTINLANPTGCAANPFYTFYSALPKPDLFQGTTYPLSVTFLADGTQYLGVWFDFDNNGIYNTTEFFGTTSATGSNGTVTININVPVTASLGNIRMRVRGGEDSQLSNSQACGASSSGYGEAEDYLVTILPPPNCSTLLPFPATAATASPVSVCAGSNVNFGITVPMPSALGITYQWLRNGVAFGVPQTSANVTLPVTLSGNYSVEVKCNGTTQVTSSAIAITANNPQVLGVTNGTRCGLGSVNLNATSSAGSNLRYYDASTGGNLLASRASGVAYATATLPGPSSTNFYVEAFSVAASGTSGPVNPSYGSYSSYSTFFGVYQEFTTSSAVKITSIDLYPTTAGSAVFELQDNLGNTIASYTQVVTALDANSATGVIGTPLTVPLNFDVPVGTGWVLAYVSGPNCLRNNGGSLSYYGPQTNDITFTGNSNFDNNYWYHMYNWQVVKECKSARSLVTATVTAAPSIATTPTTSISICEGDATTLQVSSTNLTYVYTWTPGPVVGSSISVSPLATTSYTVNGVTSLGCTNSKTITVRVNPKPATPTSVTSIPSGSPITFCPNPDGTFAPVQINATATSLVNTLFFEDFAFGAGTGWQTAYQQNDIFETHGALARWTFPSAPPAYTYPGYPQTFNSTGSFAVAIGDAQGFTSTGSTAILTSPDNTISINSAATSVVLTYDVSYNSYPGDVFQVEYSRSNSTWTPIVASVLSDLTDVPTTLGDFATQTITIPSAAYSGGEANFRLRFSYYSEYGYWVAVDNVQLKETITTPLFSFSPAGGLYTDLAATTAYAANTPVASVYAAPFNNSVYNVSVKNQSTGCVSNPLALAVNVCSVVTDQICNAASVTVLDAPPANLATVINRTNLGAPITGSLAGLCTPLKSDVWFKSVIPPSGDIHVYTFDAANAVNTFDLDSTVVAIYSSSDGTCTGTLTQLGCDAFNGVDGHSYVSASGLTPGSNVFIRVGSRQANIAPPVGFFKVLVLSGLYWSGNAGDYVFLNPSNWYGGDGTTSGILPSISKSIIIPQSASNNYPYVIGTQDVHGINFYYNTLSANAARITIDPAAKLRINSSLQRGGFVTATANPFVLANPRIVGTGVLEFVNTNVNPLYNIHNINTPSTATQIMIEGALGVKTNAQLNSNGKLSFINNAVLLSGGVKTANLAYNYGGTVNGSIIYRRSGSAYGMYDYWSSPISNGNTTCLATSYGSNLYTYNNTAPGAGANVQLGWGSPLPASTAMQIGRGYIQTYAGNGSVTFNGLPNQVSFDYTPTITGANNFNLIGNPFPSSLKINELRARGTNAGTLGSIYLWNQSGSTPFTSGDYVVINSSNLAAGGTPPSGYGVSALELGACQAFMTDVQNTNDITFSCEDRVPTYPVNSIQFFDVTSNISLVRLDLKNSVGTAVNTVVAFSETSSDQFVGGEDSPRMPGTTGFDIYSKLDNQDLVIQMFSPLQATRIVDLGTSMTTNGEYTISMTEYVDFDPSTRVFLEDRANGTFQGLNSNPNYTFTTDPSFQGVRFRLHFMAPVNMASSSTCVGETNGKLIVSNSNMAYPMTAVLKNNNGETVSNSGQFVGEHIFQNLSSGNYTVDMSYVDGSVFSLSSNVGVSGVLSPASFIASSNSVQLADAIIEFAATAPGATEFIWNFGDGTIETTSATPVHAYMQPGIYTVTLTALSGGCSSTATSVVSVTDNTTGIANVGNSKGFSIYPNPANEAAKLLLNVDLKDAQATISITDAAGRLVNKHNLTNLRSGAIVDLDINGLANGVYEVSIDSKNFRSVGRLTIAK